MNEFDFNALCGIYRQHRRWFLINMMIAFVVTLFIALSIPKSYKSKVRLVTEAQKEGNFSGSMGSLASLAGINLNGSTDAISPELYPDVVSSNRFLIDMLYVPVQTKKGKSYASYLEYSTNEEKRTWWSAATKATIKAIVGLIKPPKPESLVVNARINPSQLTLKEEEIIEGIRKSIECTIDDKSGVITLTATTQDPKVSKMMVDNAKEKLQTFIIDYRTNKVRFDLKYYQSLEIQLHHKYLKAKQKYAEFADAHMDVALKSYSTEEADFENAMQNAYNTYAQMKQQVVSAEGKVQEKTPAFTIVEDSFIPNKASSPKTILMLLASLFLGLTGTGLWYYFKLLFSGSASRQTSL